MIQSYYQLTNTTMTIEQQLQELIGKRVVWRDKGFLIKSVRKLNSRFLISTDSKMRNMDEQTAKNLLETATILN